MDTEKEGDPSSIDDDERVLVCLKQIVKKARAFEVRRLLRRAKLLQHKKGSDNQLAKNRRKAERIVGDVQQLRTFTTDELTNVMYEAVTNGRKAKMSLEEYLSSQSSAEFIKDQVISSLMISKLMYSQLSRLVSLSTVDEFMMIPKNQLPRSPTISRRKVRVSDKVGENVRKKSNSNVETAAKATSLINTVISTDENTSMDNDNSSEFEEDDFFLCNSNDDRLLVKRSKVNSPQNKQPSLGNRKTVRDPIHEHDNNIKLQSTFIGSMNCKKHTSSRNLSSSPQKKNRMGQRARQKLWSVKYGPSAKHSVSTGGVKYKKFQKAQDTRKNSGRKKNINGEGRTQGVENLAFDAHPSWEAKRKEKASQQIQEFKGTKITFDDD